MCKTLTEYAMQLGCLVNEVQIKQEIGLNNVFVFMNSHSNGELPSDELKQAIVLSLVKKWTHQEIEDQLVGNFSFEVIDLLLDFIWVPQDKDGNSSPVNKAFYAHSMPIMQYILAFETALMKTAIYKKVDVSPMIRDHLSVLANDQIYQNSLVLINPTIGELAKKLYAQFK